MIELTRDDLAAIRSALGERYPIDERDQAIYRAGMAAGIERSMEACDREREIYQLGPPGSLRNDIMRMGRSAYLGCAAAIRALLKEQR